MNQPPTKDFEELLAFIKTRKKRFGNVKQAKSGVVYGMGFVSYVARQSEHIFSTPDFEWSFFQSAYYDDEF